jgi:hypothetical protein
MMLLFESRCPCQKFVDGLKVCHGNSVRVLDRGDIMRYSWAADDELHLHSFRCADLHWLHWSSIEQLLSLM